MESRFRKTLTSVPDVVIEVGRQGLSTTIGWDSSEANNKTGVRAQDGFVGSRMGHVGDPRYSGPLPTDQFLIPGTRTDFGTGNVSEMTSPGLSGFKALLVATRQRERDVKTEIERAERQLWIASVVNALSWITLLSVAVSAARQSG